MVRQHQGSKEKKGRGEVSQVWERRVGKKKDWSIITGIPTRLKDESIRRSGGENIPTAITHSNTE